MNQNNARVYDVFDTLLTTNILDLLRMDDPVLHGRAVSNYPLVRQEVDERERFYRGKGVFRTTPLPGVQEGLERTLKTGYVIGVYSNGTQENIRRLLREGGIEGLVQETVSVDDVGLKDNLASYGLLVARFGRNGLAVVSFADDGLLYCEAAALSGVIPEVYHVKPDGKGSTAVPGVRWVASVADIDK